MTGSQTCRNRDALPGRGGDWRVVVKTLAITGAGVGATAMAITLAIGFWFSESPTTPLGGPVIADNDELQSAPRTGSNVASSPINPFVNAPGDVFEEPVNPPRGEVIVSTEMAAEEALPADDLLQPLVPDLSPDEIERLHEQQLRAYEDAASDSTRLVDLPPSSDPPHVITMGELDLLHAQQESAFRAEHGEDLDFVMPLSPEGSAPISAKALAARHQEEERQARSFDNGDLLRLPAFAQDERTATMTVGELSRRLDAQTEEAQRASSEGYRTVTLPPSSDSQHGVTFVELDRLHSEQGEQSR